MYNESEQISDIGMCEKPERSSILGQFKVPLSVMHYERDKEQGNVTRSLLKGGLLGLGHINKGTSEMGNSEYEYQYIDEYINRSSLGILQLDLWIIWKGIILILKGGGH